MSEQRRRTENELARGCIFVIVVVAAAPVVYALLTRWYECQRLAPIVRAFTPGC